MAKKPEILPPAPSGIAAVDQSTVAFAAAWHRATPLTKGFFLFLTLGTVASVSMFAIGQFFQTRGVQSLVTSRAFLVVAWLFPTLWVWQAALSVKAKRWRWIAGIVTVVLLLAICTLDRAFPMPKIVSVPDHKHTPLITIKVQSSAFPVSVPAHSVLLILPLHPYQTFTDVASRLHEFDNSCGEEHMWPTPDEINSKPTNTFEAVRRIEVANHSPDTMESGRLVFGVLYNDSFGGGCMSPPASAVPQDDVVSIPALDSGKSFEFVTVNQTSRCAWLLVPTMIKAKMASDDNATDVPIKLEPSVVANWDSSPFGPTAIKWQGVPIKNPGYGLVRSGAQCAPPNDDRKRHEIQSKLARLMNEGIVIRSKWQQVMGQPEDTQRMDSGEIPYWHAQIENYIRTLPRSDVYLAKLNSAHRTDLGYPIGIDLKLAGFWDLLLLDLRELKEFMDDPDFGRP